MLQLDEEATRRPVGWLHRLSRSHLRDRVVDLLRHHRVVVVQAGRGWGKSTLAEDVSLSFGGPARWVRCAELLEGGLEESVAGGPGLIVVVDAEELVHHDGLARQLRRLAETAEDVPGSGVAALLLTHGALPGTLRRAADELRIAVLTSSDLRLSMGEVEELRSRSAAANPLSATEVMRLTGGWPRGVGAAVQLDAHNPRTVDLLDDAIESSVMADLGEAERDLIIRVSVLDSADPATVAALLGEEAGRTWERIGRLHLPMVISEGGRLTLRPPLRDYLRSELARVHPGAAEQLRSAYLSHLRAHGALVEVIDWYLDRGSRAQALDLIVEAADLDLDPLLLDQAFDRWAQSLGVDALVGRDATAGLMIRVLHRRGQTEQAALLGQQLIDEGRMQAILEADPELRPVVVYCLHNRPEVALRLLPQALGSYSLGSIAYSVAVTGSTRPVEPPDRAEWGDLAIHVLWGLLWQGRLQEAIDAMTQDGVVTEPTSSLALAALWSDQPALAEEVYRRIPKSDGYPWAQFVSAALALHDGDHQRGLRVLSAAMPAAQRQQAAPTFETLAACLMLKAGDTRRAIRHLETRLPQHQTSGRRAVGEWAQFILALGYLEQDRHDAAAQILEPAISAMEQAERFLLLSAARLAYAEASARGGAPTQVVRRLLDTALTTRAGVGSSYWEREALLHARELRRLGLVDGGEQTSSGPDVRERAPAVAEPVGLPGGPVGRLSTFEQPAALELDGIRHPLGRTKLAELIADLAVHGGSVDRAALQMRLFPYVGQRSAGNHFRQVLFKLRELTGVVLDRPSRNEIGWPAGGTLDATDLVVEAQLRRLLTQARVDTEALRAMLDLMTGPYLSTSELSWVVERRQLLNLLFEEGVLRLLRDPDGSVDLDIVRIYGMRAVVLSPYSEDVYRLMIEAELDRGSAQRARAVYRRAVHAMKDLGLEPSGEIRALARRLGQRLSAEQGTQGV
ncbi:hypothetical protein P5P86_09980 [Nocardioides sp. BP30]|uniref:hypothetical protein n=1 Tax=Nocardioides sp. BP30 TaxID=3036374 RepID=UPI0024685657|nr:hypothetical protein [Nocardioides sp. BP30]WGL54140.1 hypothetical protein P5P86_09980 [Nocardioides sp. BP30]